MVRMSSADTVGGSTAVFTAGTIALRDSPVDNMSIIDAWMRSIAIRPSRNSRRIWGDLGLWEHTSRDRAISSSSVGLETRVWLVVDLAIPWRLLAIRPDQEYLET